MKLILLGPPGAGKGTQAIAIANRYSIPRIATGDILRAAIKAQTPLGKKVQQIVANGALVPDEIVINLVKDRLAEKDCTHGYLLDGFPRTIAQAEALATSGIKLDAVIELAVPDEEIVTRLSGRRIHVASGRTYHILHQPPKIPNQDDITAEPLIQREDDQEQVIRKRLEVYHAQTKPLSDHYQKQAQTTNLRYLKINGVGTLIAIQERIVAALN